MDRNLIWAIIQAMFVCINIAGAVWMHKEHKKCPNFKPSFKIARNLNIFAAGFCFIVMVLDLALCFQG